MTTQTQNATVADAPQPTEDQVKAANEAEQAKWEGDFKEEDLVIPYKREEKTDEKVDDKEGTDGTSDSTDGGNKRSGGDKSGEEVPPREPEPVVTVEDPGEYKAADYSFEVTLKDGKSVKITTPEEAEKLSEDPDNFETPKQLLDFINKSTQMQNKLDKDYERWESKHKTFTEYKESEAQRSETIENFSREFEYLVGKNLLPPVAKEYLNADWNDPEVAKQPGVKEQIELLNYMVKENTVRAKAKVKQITSVVDAFNAWKQDEGEQKKEADRKAADEAKVAAGEARKAAGAKVAGVSPAQQGSYVPKGIAVGNPNVFKRGAAVWDN